MICGGLISVAGLLKLPEFIKPMIYLVWILSKIKRVVRAGRTTDRYGIRCDEREISFFSRHSAAAFAGDDLTWGLIHNLYWYLWLGGVLSVTQESFRKSSQTGGWNAKSVLLVPSCTSTQLQTTTSAWLDRYPHTFPQSEWRLYF